MKLGLASIPPSEFVRRILERNGPGNWFVLVAPPADAQQLMEQVVGGITDEVSDEIVKLYMPASADEVAAAVMRAAIAVVAGLEGWSLTEWARFDVLRSLLAEKAQKVALILSEEGAGRLFTQAPHFARFFTGSAWQAELDAGSMSDSERLARINALERSTGMSTEEMLRRAENRALPAEPEFAEWIALVGRSELL